MSRHLADSHKVPECTQMLHDDKGVIYQDSAYQKMQTEKVNIKHAIAYFMAQPGVQVFTTCGAQKKRDYLQQTFPFLDDAHIGDSRSTSFEDLIKEQVSTCPCHDVLALTMHCALSLW